MLRKQSIIFFVIVFSFLILQSPTLHGGSIGVRPLHIDLYLSPGQKGSFQITISSTTPEESTDVHLSLFDAVQQLSGAFAWQKVGSYAHSCSPWIKLDEGDVIVPAGGKITVKGEVTIPRGQRGTHLACIMVEPSPGARPEVGVTFKIRYAVLLRVRVKGPRLMERLKLENIVFAKIKGKPHVGVILTNPSQVDFNVEGTAQITDRKNRVREKVTINTQSGLNRRQPTTIFPDSTVALVGPLTRFLEPGEYKLRAMINYGSRKRRVFKEGTIVVKPGDFPTEMLAEGSLNLQLMPATLELNVLPGGFRTAPISISSQEFEPIQLQGYFKDFTIGPDGKMVFPKTGKNEYSCANWLKLTPPRFTLRPGQSRKMALTVRVPKNAGSEHYAKLFFKTGSAGQEIEGPIVFINTDRTINKAGEINSLLVNAKAEEPEFTVSFKNSGNTHLSCKAALTIRDERGLIDSISIKEGQLVLPDGIRNFVLASKKKLPPGKYTAEATIDYGGGGAVNKEIPIRVSIDEDQQRLVEVIESKEKEIKSEEK